MKVLLDTHAFLWWVSDDPRVSRRARRIIADSSNQILLSAASAWEIAIKTALGRLMIASDPEEFVPEQMRMNGFEPLPIELRHALHVG
ncbi:MAG TPA: type II toxin-antitoxin system VapC family toxin, partial [Candidatus Binataceae bacterium]|nr:type II toxin-antitoxin system VapC family toxin [Candidatus Binataceae bacterium]